MRQIAAIAVIVAAGGVLAACDWAHDVGGRINPDSLSLADRCAEIVKMAAPSEQIDIDSRNSEGDGIDMIVARVGGTRVNLPKGDTEDPQVAAECQFDDTILSGFRWTKGGPPPHGGTPQ